MKKISFNQNDPLGSKLSSDLKYEVGKYLAQVSKYGNWELYLKTFVLFLGFCVLYYLLLFVPTTIYVKVLISVGLGLGLALIGFNVMHDGNHGSYSRIKWVNQLMGLTLNFFGGNSNFWKLKHNVNHHTFVNIKGHDSDLDIPFLRLNENEEKRWYHKYQHVYCWILYLLSFIFWIYFQEFQKYSSYSKKKIGLYAMDTKQHLIFWISKAIHWTVFLVIPLIFLSLTEFFVFIFVFYATAGLTMSIVFQMAHVMPDSEFPVVSDGKEKLENGYLVHQIQTTSNFATKSNVAFWLFGGLNFQIEHHIFPHVSHVHYRTISEFVKRICKENKVIYKEHKTFFGAVFAHLFYLKQLGN